MDNNDRVAFEAIMQGLAENFSSSLTTNGISLRFEAMRRFDIDTVRNAALAIVASRKYTTMPTVAEFLEHIAGGNVEDVGMVEAAKVWAAIRKHGGTRSVCFDDPTTQAVIVNNFGGWQKLCRETMEDQQKWFIKDFVGCYSAYKRRGINHYGALPGYADPYNSGGPALIGDVSKAQLVLTTKEHDKPLLANIQKMIENTA